MCSDNCKCCFVLLDILPFLEHVIICEKKICDYTNVNMVEECHKLFITSFYYKIVFKLYFIVWW